MSKYDSRRAKYRQSIIERFKTFKGCKDCGYKEHHAALEFDHIRGKKYRNVASLLFASWKVIKEEIGKCDIVCSNCHSIRTYNRRQKTL